MPARFAVNHQHGGGHEPVGASLERLEMPAGLGHVICLVEAAPLALEHLVCPENEGAGLVPADGKGLLARQGHGHVDKRRGAGFEVPAQRSLVDGRRHDPEPYARILQQLPS